MLANSGRSALTSDLVHSSSNTDNEDMADIFRIKSSAEVADHDVPALVDAPSPPTTEDSAQARGDPEQHNKMEGAPIEEAPVQVSPLQAGEPSAEFTINGDVEDAEEDEEDDLADAGPSESSAIPSYLKPYAVAQVDWDPASKIGLYFSAAC
jgi:hypothetical protein